MKRRGIRRLRRFAWWPKNRAGRVLILLYHRVAALRSDPWLLGVTPKRFAEQLEILQQHARPMRLQHLSQGFRDGNLPDRSVVITFDDGYADNLHNAKPLLERYAVPATVFLTTGYIGHEREFWWDELDRLLLQPETLPRMLSLNVDGSKYQWKLGKAARYDAGPDRRRRGWGAWKNLFSSRPRFYRSIWRLLHSLTESERQKVLTELRIWANAEPLVRSTHRALSLEEVVALGQGELVEVGAHTVTHPALSTIPAASQRREIVESKARLEHILDQRVDSFAYPHGSLSTETVGIVREAGFGCSCSTFAGLVGSSTDRFRLPRMQVMDWDGEEFARRLSRWFRD